MMLMLCGRDVDPNDYPQILVGAHTGGVVLPAFRPMIVPQTE